MPTGRTGDIAQAEQFQVINHLELLRRVIRKGFATWDLLCGVIRKGLGALDLLCAVIWKGLSSLDLLCAVIRTSKFRNPQAQRSRRAGWRRQES